MRVMVFGKATDDTENGASVTPEAFEAMEKFSEELIRAGVLLDGGGLMPSSKGKRVAFDGARRTVIDGPFAETRELVAGFMIWEVKDMDEAVAWVMRSPSLGPGPSVTEIRPLGEMAAVEESPAPETTETHYRIRESHSGA